MGVVGNWKVFDIESWKWKFDKSWDCCVRMVGAGESMGGLSWGLVDEK
jgi:hypothetical protein